MGFLFFRILINSSDSRAIIIKFPSLFAFFNKVRCPKCSKSKHPPNKTFFLFPINPAVVFNSLNETIFFIAKLYNIAMNQITEVLQEKPSVLLVAKKHNHILNLLKRQLKKYNADVFLSPELPAKLDRFQYFFIFNPELLPKKKLFTQDTKLICLFINKPRLADQFEQNLQKLPLKVVSLTGNSFNDTHIDRLIWFALSRSNEIHLKLNTFKSVVRLKTPWFKINLRIPKRRQIILAGLYTFLLLHLAFVPPLLISSFFTYQSALALKQEQDKTVSKYLKIS